MKDLLDKWFEKLTQMTKDEADFMEKIIKMDHDNQAAFLFAKRFFEEGKDGK